MRSEQQMLRDWVEEQGEQTRRLATVMERVSQSMSGGQSDLFDRRPRDRDPGE